MDKAGRADVPTNVCPSRRSRAPGVIGRCRGCSRSSTSAPSQTNGKAERLVQTALREWAYTRAYRHSDQRAAELPYWLHRYNWHPQSRSGQFLSHMNPDVSSAGAQDTALFCFSHHCCQIERYCASTARVYLAGSPKSVFSIRLRNVFRSSASATRSCAFATLSST